MKLDELTAFTKLGNDFIPKEKGGGEREGE